MKAPDLCLSSDFIEPLLPCFLKVAIVRQDACEAWVQTLQDAVGHGKNALADELNAPAGAFHLLLEAGGISQHDRLWSMIPPNMPRALFSCQGPCLGER